MTNIDEMSINAIRVLSADAIQKAAYTGEVGDGKIFSYEIRSAMKIRTRETGYDALQSKEQIL